MPNTTVLINSIASPLQIGLYENEQCIKSYTLDGQTSDVLLMKLENIMRDYEIQRFIYVNGPGSYMAIKLTYIMLQTIKLIKGIPFYGCSAFELNSGQPVRAIGKLYFIKEKETIITQKFDDRHEQKFSLPEDMSGITLSEDNTPQYILPVV